MSNRTLQYAFTAGVLSQRLWSQTILQKYGFGLAEAENWTISNTGGLISRGGLVAGTLADLDENTPFHFVPFVYAYELQNTFGLLFTPNKIRFLQGGNWVLEDAKAITATSSTSTDTVVTCAAHGFAVGDLVEFSGTEVPTALVGQTVEVTAVGGVNSFTVRQINLAQGLNWTDAAIAAGEVSRVYTLASSYDANFSSLYFYQVRDQIRITSLYYPVHTLTRQNDGTWLLEAVDTGIHTSPVTNGGMLAFTGSGTNTYSVAFAITAVDIDGQESLPYYIRCQAIKNYSFSAGAVRIGWTPVADAVFYNVYRSVIRQATTISPAAQEFGYVGTAYGNSFEDDNIIPDYTKMPPRCINPFSDGAIRQVKLTAPGSGYSFSSTLTLTDPNGTDAMLVPVISEDGKIGAIMVQSEGIGYTNPSISLSGGTGATFEIVLREAGMNYPAVSCVHQQRAVYGSTLGDPLAIIGSQTGLLNNMSYSRILAANESYSYDIDSRTLGFIRHFVSTKHGLLAFTDIGVWTVAANNGAVSPTDIDVAPETENGCSGLVPLNIDTDYLYSEAGNHLWRLLTYNDYTRAYGGKNISILGSDLIAEPYDLTSWTYAARPFNIVSACRDDGILVNMTLDSEQDVFAMYPYTTYGEIVRIISLRESAKTVVYVVVRRFLNGRWVYSIEYFFDRTISTDETHCGLDCAVPFGFTYGTGRLSLADDGVTFTSSEADFASAAVNDVIRHRGGKAVITSVDSDYTVTTTIIDSFSSLEFKAAATYTGGKYRSIPAETWTLSRPVSSLTLPLNFRPELVTVYADGIVHEDLTVNQLTGAVALPAAASIGWAGIPFRAVAKTLPLAIDGALVEASRKNIKGVGVRFINTKGITIGTSLDDLYPIEAIQHDEEVERELLRAGFEKVFVSSDWTVDEPIYIVCDKPTPAEVTGLSVLVNIGDGL